MNDWKKEKKTMKEIWDLTSKVLKRLAYLRKNDLPQDDNLFWRTVGFYGDVYGDSKDDAVKYLTRLVNHFIKEGVV